MLSFVPIKEEKKHIKDVCAHKRGKKAYQKVVSKVPTKSHDQLSCVVVLQLMWSLV